MNILSIDTDWAISNLHQQHLASLFYSKVDNAKSIVFANYHHMIVSELQDINNINLYNVDHHHDVCYNENQYRMITETNNVNEGSWVGGLLYLNKLDSLTWVRNIESESILTDEPSAHFIRKSNSQFSVDYSIERLYNIDYDMIFVCRSDDCIEASYRGLYDIMRLSCVQLYSKKTKQLACHQDIPGTKIKI